jgi:hypothetical protein
VTDVLLPWSISGTYLEACNCEAICPCRRVGGRQGGRSTSGVCAGALSWVVQSGSAGPVDLSGLAAVLVFRYDDDVEGSRWLYRLYVDERGDDAQREALAAILTGKGGGTPQRQCPWVWKPADFLGWRPAPIEIDHTPRRGWFRVRDEATVRVRDAVPDQEPVTCVIPGHHRSGTEVVCDVLRVESGSALSFDMTARCGYESTFDYSSEGAISRVS